MGIHALSITKAVAVLILIAALTACKNDRGPTITVKEPLLSEKSSHFALDRLDRLDDVYCADWVAEQQVICVPNILSSESTMMIRNLQTGEVSQTNIAAGTSLQVSPDQKHAFVISHNYGVEMAALGSHDTFPISLKIGDSSTSWISTGSQGSWADEKTYILPVINRGFATVDIDGKVVYSSLDSKQASILKLVKKGDLVYSLNVSSQLQMFTKDNSSAPRLIRDHVVSFSLSPDGSKLAFAVQIAPNQESLYVVNAANGAEETFIAKGRLLRQISWSPDGSKLAFTVLSLDQGMTGLYVMHAQSGRMTPFRITRIWRDRSYGVHQVASLW